MTYDFVKFICFAFIILFLFLNLTLLSESIKSIKLFKPVKLFLIHPNIRLFHRMRRKFDIQS